MARKKTSEEFVEEVYELVGEEYIFLEAYKGSGTKILCKHNTCEHEWNVRPTSFLKGTRCPQCAGNIQFTYEEVKYFIEVKSGSGCKMLSQEYNNCNENILLQCKCGEIFEATFAKFKNRNKTQCNRCGRKRANDEKIKPDKKFKEQVHSLTNGEYVFQEPYTNSKTKMPCLHVVCNNIWEITPSKFLSGNRCPQCNRPNYNMDTEQYKKQVYIQAKSEYEVLGEYINSQTKIKMRHSECGHVWEITPNNFLRGRRCPKCGESKGEQKVRGYLESKNIVFEQECSIDDLLSDKNNPLRFDFYLIDFNLFIEYDGEFHFKQIHEGCDLKTQQYHDELKNQYCKDNNIPLLRIPYWELGNLERIIDETLINYKKDVILS